MCAELIKFGDPSPTVGGQYERKVIQTLHEKLSHKYLIITNPSFPTKSSFFYEYDVIVLSPFLCDIVEVKYLFAYVNVHEDWLESINGFQVAAVFSLLETKNKVFSSKLREQFRWKKAPRTSSRVIVGPENTKIRFKYQRHKQNDKLLKLQDAIRFYKNIEKQNENKSFDIDEWKRFKKVLKNHSENLQKNQRKTNRLGRFYIKKCITQDNDFPDYWACDEPPCKVDVYLKEFPFEPFARPEDIDTYLKKVTRGMQILRGLRHQYISCVTGHFQTGCSLVQVSDWFDGQSLEQSWNEIRELSLNEKIDLMIKIVQGLGYCHERGVFHRNICAKNILVSNNLDDIRITGFDFAKDVDLTCSATSTRMSKRNGKVIPPEELLHIGAPIQNLRLYDIYQTGLLFYRILENSLWPFDNALDYCTSAGDLKEAQNHKTEKGFKQIQKLISKMLKLKPENRPDLMQKIEDELKKVLEMSY